MANSTDDRTLTRQRLSRCPSKYCRQTSNRPSSLQIPRRSDQALSTFYCFPVMAWRNIALMDDALLNCLSMPTSLSRPVDLRLMLTSAMKESFEKTLNREENFIKKWKNFKFSLSNQNFCEFLIQQNQKFFNSSKYHVKHHFRKRWGARTIASGLQKH